MEKDNNSKNKILSKITGFFVKNGMGFIIGVIAASATAVVAATLISSSDVVFDNSGTNLNSTNVQGAIGELYDIVDNKLTTYAYGVPTIYSPIDFNDVIASSGSRVFIQKMGNELSVCAYGGAHLFCIKNNDYANSVEKLKTEYDNSGCTQRSTYFECFTDDDFIWDVDQDGNVYCGDDYERMEITLYSDGSVVHN